MGRRALPRIDPSISTAEHLVELEALAAPLSVAALFGRSGPLEVEVGSGKGLFLSTAAAAHPDRLLLGIEIARRYAQFAAYRLARQQAPNAKVIHGDAAVLFRERLADQSVDAVHVYFPDPWWKARHRKRRVINPGFVENVARVLRPGGVFHFWTDVEEYFETACLMVAEHGRLAGGPDSAEAEGEDRSREDDRTHFERRMRLADQTVFRAVFRRP